MAKFTSFPTLYEEVKQIHLSKLKEWDYLNPGQIKEGTLSWSMNGKDTGSISIRVNTLTEEPFLELDYKCGDIPINYQVKLVRLPSNLGIGYVWYFLCPKTQKRCRILYLVDGYFYHRRAFTGCYYEQQIESKQWRKLRVLFDNSFKIEKAYEQIQKKYLKTHYKGKPTKSYLRLLKQLDKSSQETFNELSL